MTKNLHCHQEQEKNFNRRTVQEKKKVNDKMKVQNDNSLMITVNDNSNVHKANGSTKCQYKLTNNTIKNLY